LRKCNPNVFVDTILAQLPPSPAAYDPPLRVKRHRKGGNAACQVRISEVDVTPPASTMHPEIANLAGII